MSTIKSATEQECLHFEQFRRYIPGGESMDPKTVTLLAKLGGLQVSTLMELAVANLSGWWHDSQKGWDIRDGSEVKYATCRGHSKGKSYGANISGLHNKTGDLRVQILNRRGNHLGPNQFYWFIIPRCEYEHITTDRGNLEIPFSPDGTPNRIARRQDNVNNLWTYEVPTFERMAISNSLQERDIRLQHVNTLFEVVA